MLVFYFIKLFIYYLLFNIYVFVIFLTQKYVVKMIKVEYLILFKGVGY